MVEVWNCSTRFESAKMAKEALDSVATKSFIRLTSSLTWHLSLQLLCGHLGDVIGKILKKTLALDLNSQCWAIVDIVTEKNLYYLNL